MSEEKKAALEDDALEGIAGGKMGLGDLYYFMQNNCNSCRRYFNRTCPPGLRSQLAEETNGSGTCPEKDPV